MEKSENLELKNQIETNEKKQLNQTEENKTQTSKETIGYSKKSFWDERFSKEEGNFDWYVDWEQLKPKLKNIIKEKGENITKKDKKKKKSKKKKKKNGLKN
jgi:hypothetical protein